MCPLDSTLVRNAVALHRRSRPAWKAVALCGALACGAHGASWATDTEASPKVNVWGLEEAQAPAGRSAITRTVALQQSRFGDANARGAAFDRPGSAQTSAPGRTGVQVTDVSYRWGVADRRGGVDVGVGAGAYKVHGGVDAAGQPLAPAVPGLAVDGRREIVVPTVSVGMRRSLSDQHRIDVAASGSTSLSSAAVGEFYTAKVKVEWLPTKNSSLGFEQAAVNMRFNANSNVAVRVRGGGAMVYYRSKF